MGSASTGWGQVERDTDTRKHLQPSKGRLGLRRAVGNRREQGWLAGRQGEGPGSFASDGLSWTHCPGRQGRNGFYKAGSRAGAETGKEACRSGSEEPVRLLRGVCGRRVEPGWGAGIAGGDEEAGQANLKG